MHTINRRLTPTKRQVLVLLAQGHSNAEIGAHLHISADTVKTHLRQIFDRLGARNRAHCVHLAHHLRIDEVSAADPNILESRRQVSQEGPDPVEFKRVGLVYRPKPPGPAPQTPTPPTSTDRATPKKPASQHTHTLRVEHPTINSETWQIDVTVADDLEARDRMELLAGRVFPPRRVRLFRSNQLFEIASTAARRTD